MATHELKIEPRWLERVAAGDKTAEVRRHDRDFQRGDLLELVPINKWGNRAQVFVERDERGRFVNAYVDQPGITVEVTHVLDGRQVDGLDDEYCVLSIRLRGAR